MCTRGTGTRIDYRDVVVEEITKARVRFRVRIKKVGTAVHDAVHEALHDVEMDSGNRELVMKVKDGVIKAVTMVMTQVIRDIITQIVALIAKYERDDLDQQFRRDTLRISGVIELSTPLSWEVRTDKWQHLYFNY